MVFIRIAHVSGVGGKYNYAYKAHGIDLKCHLLIEKSKLKPNETKMD